MTTRKVISPEQIGAIFTDTFGDAIEEVKIREWHEGMQKSAQLTIWIRMERAILHDAVARLVEIDYPHLGVISGVDTGENVELLYHFFIFFGMKHQEIGVTFNVALPKSDLTIPTISDIIPGAVYGEREKQDFLGIVVTGIPDSRRLFLPEDFPDGVYPWRKDETGITDGMINELWASGRPTDRPAPPVKPKEKKPPAEEPAKEKPAAGEPETEPGAGQKVSPAKEGVDDTAAGPTAEGEAEVKQDE